MDCPPQTTGGAYSDCCEYKDRGGNASGDLEQITPSDKRIAWNENSESDDGVGGYPYDSGPGGGPWYGGIGVTSVVKNEGGAAGFTWVRQGALEIQLPIGSPGGKDGTRGGWGFGPEACVEVTARALSVDVHDELESNVHVTRRA